MVIPLIVGGVVALVTRGLTASVKNKETEEKLELVKKLAGLSPEQARAVDAVKVQSVEELQTRVELGIGPFAPLPPTASKQAQEQRERRMAALAGKNVGTQLVKVTDAERAQVEAAPDKEAAISALVAKKMTEAKSTTHPIY